MDTLDSGLWHGNFEKYKSVCCLGSDSILYAPLKLNKYSVYRFNITLINLKGNGRIYFNLSDKDNNFSPMTLNCPEDEKSWKTYEIDLPVGRCLNNADGLLKICRNPIGDGAIYINDIQYELLKKGVGPNPVPILLGQKPFIGVEEDEDIFKEELDYVGCEILMEEGMEDFDQQIWRGKDLVIKKDKRGSKCISMGGNKSLIFVPVKVEQNSIYRCHIDIKKETGNGKFFCNFYANRSFDFPQIAVTCENINWGTFDIQLKTGNFPSNLPIVLRLWRSPSGTGSLLVKRIAIEKLPNDIPFEDPKLITLSTSERTVSVQPKVDVPIIKRPRPRKNKNVDEIVTQGFLPQIGNFPFSAFDRQPTNVLVASEIGDEISMKQAFEKNGIKASSISSLSAESVLNAIKISNANWIHFHICKNTTLTLETIAQIKSIKNDIIMTLWISPSWPVFDNSLLPLLRMMNTVFVESEIELSAYRSGGCFNTELWDPGFDVFVPTNEYLGDKIIVFPDNDYLSDGKSDLIDELTKHFKESINILEKKEKNYRSLLSEAKLVVFSDFNPSRVLFEMLSIGIPVLAKRSFETAEWCEDKKDLLFFDTPAECVDLIMKIDDNYKNLGERGSLVSAYHTRASRVKELSIRNGCFEVTTQLLPPDKTTYKYDRIMCVFQKAPLELISYKNNGIEFLGASFTECRDLLAKIIRFHPDVLHIHLNEKDDSLPWRDLLLNIRRFVPTMQISIWHAGGKKVDRRIKDMRFFVDQIFIGNQKYLETYKDISLIGVDEWNPGVSPSEDPLGFYNSITSLIQKIKNKKLTKDNRNIDLTVFIGTFNRLDQLKQSIESISRSSGSKIIEIIINDAGSSDGTKDWIQQISNGNNLVVPIFSNKRTSFTQAFNEALQIARGKYICWLSDDIISEGTALNDMCDIMNKLAPIDMGGFSVKNSWCYEYSVRKDSGFYFPTVGCMYTETLKKLGGFNMDYPFYGQDTELDTRILKLGGRIVACTNCKLLHNCINDELRKDNFNKHINTMGNMKYEFVFSNIGKTTTFQYPRILLVPSPNTDPDRIMKIANSIRSQYSNSYIFVGAENSEQLNTRGPNSFIRKIFSSSVILDSFNMIVEIGKDKNVLTKPNGSNSSPFIRKILD